MLPTAFLAQLANSEENCHRRVSSEFLLFGNKIACGDGDKSQAQCNFIIGHWCLALKKLEP
jgi:hypothetical protein